MTRKGVGTAAFLVMTVFCGSVHSEPSTPSDSQLLRALTTEPGAVEPPEGFCEAVIDADARTRWTYAIAPAGDRLAYALDNPDDPDTLIATVDLATGRRATLYRQPRAANRFLPDELLWSPDGKEVWAYFGFLDVGFGEWFAFDAARGGLSRDHERFNALIRINDPVNAEGIVPENGQVRAAKTPVWGIDGRRYRNSIEAERAGVKRFLPTQLNSTSALCVGSAFHTPDGLVVAVHVAADPPHTYLLRGDTLVGCLQTEAAPVRDLWFFRTEDRLVVKKQTVVSRPRPQAKPSDPVSDNKVDVMIKVELPWKGRIFQSFDLGRDAMLVIQGRERRQLVMLRPSALNTLAAELAKPVALVTDRPWTEYPSAEAVSKMRVAGIPKNTPGPVEPTLGLAR